MQKADDPSLPSPNEFLRNNLPWLLGLIPVLLTALSIVISTHGDSQISGFVLQHVSVLPLVLSILLPVLPPAAVWVMIGVYVQWSSMSEEARKSLWLLRHPVSACVVVTPFILTMQVVWAAITAVLFLGIVIAKALAARKDQTFGLDLPIIASSVVVVAVFSFLTKTELWLPTEMISIRGQGPVTAQMIAYDGDWTTYLVLETGDVQIVRTDDVVSRESCYLSNSLTGKSVLNALFSIRADHPGVQCS